MNFRRSAYLHGLGPPLPSLILSFGILHEITALVPLVGVFLGARALGAGDKAVEIIPPDWIKEGEEWAGRVGRRYGLFGFEKRDKSKEREPEEASPVEPGRRVALAGDVANAVLAYAVVKAILPLRIGLSLWLAPGFSRRVLDPARKVPNSPPLPIY
ncbi:hypothetical protein OPQ81_002239 [Rhizoctonia solani]|nr:hypothetical protein OPQ81_002239 [Rhizoctonia solani]